MCIERGVANDMSKRQMDRAEWGSVGGGTEQKQADEKCWHGKNGGCYRKTGRNTNSEFKDRTYIFGF